MRFDNGTEILNKQDLVLAARRDWLKHVHEAAASGNPDLKRDSFIFRYFRDTDTDLVKKRYFNNPDESQAQAAAQAVIDDIDDHVNGKKSERLSLSQLTEAVCIAYKRGILKPEAALLYLGRIIKADTKSDARTKKYLEEICECEDKGSGAELIFNHDPRLEDYKAGLIYGKISDYFGKKGFKKESVETDEEETDKDKRILRYNDRPAKAADNKYDDVIRMLDSYERYVNDGSRKSIVSGSNDGLGWGSAKYREACENLYLRVYREKKDNRKEAYIPLWFDPVCGAGIFIVGSGKAGRRSVEAYLEREKHRNIHNRRTDKGKDDLSLDVYYAVVYFGTWYDNDEEMGLYDTPIHDDYSDVYGYDGDIAVTMKMTLYNSFDEAYGDLIRNRERFISCYERENYAISEIIREFLSRDECLYEDGHKTEEELAVTEEYRKEEAEARKKQNRLI